MNENEYAVTTELNPDGSTEVSCIPTEQFDGLNYEPAVEEENSSSVVGGLAAGVLTGVGAATALYGAYKGLKKLGRWVLKKKGLQIVPIDNEQDSPEDDSEEKTDTSIVEDAEVREFVDKRKEEKTGK